MRFSKSLVPALVSLCALGCSSDEKSSSSNAGAGGDATGGVGGSGAAGAGGSAGSAGSGGSGGTSGSGGSGGSGPVVGSCDDHECQNGATCVQLTGAYRCECAPGFKGQFCEDMVSPCNPNPCENGECSEVGDSFSCECDSGFTGTLCDEVEGSCSAGSCQNGGTCVDLGGSFRCDCVGGYTGTQCEIAPGPCDMNPCQNGGTCRDNGDAAECICPFGFSGATCETPSEVGLTARPSNATCVAPDRPEYTGPVEWVQLGGTQQDVMMLRQLPDGSWIGIQRGGAIYAWSSGLVPGSSPLLTISDVTTHGEMGLLGLEVHPDYPNTPHIFVLSTTGSADNPNGAPNVRIRIHRYTTTGSGASLAIDAGSQETLLDFDRNAPWNNHIGGTIEFDPQASTPMLYVSLGDGEQRSEVADPSTLFGKIIRIDVSSPPYTPEPVAVGLRNPFRFSFDSESGDLWIADVGDGQLEEIDHLAAGDLPGAGGTPLNLGWPILEGNICLNGGNPATFCGEPTPALLPLVPPVFVYPTPPFAAVIGGRVYRGSTLSGLQGTYFFNDAYGRNGETSWQLVDNPGENPNDPSDDYLTQPVPGGGPFVAYTEDRLGELYGIGFSGEIFRLEPAAGSMPTDPIPTQLSQTGCFDGALEPVDGLIPYDLNAPLWSDGATKRRWLALPDGETVSLASDGDFDFPPGTVLVKEFTLEGVRVETRLMMRHPDGVWGGYSYAWVDGSGSLVSDAELLPDQVVTRAVPGTSRTWTYPSRGQCNQCHTDAAGVSLGVEVAQLNRDLDYGGTVANQVHTLSQIGVVSGNVDVFAGRALPHYDDTSEPVANRVWSYFHSNCSGCHRPGASGYGGRSNMPDVRFDFTASTMPTHPLAQNLCGVTAGSEDLGLSNPLLVQPGVAGDWSNLSAGGSVLYLRMAARPNVPGSSGAMPLIGTADVDPEGLGLLQEWIENLACP